MRVETSTHDRRSSSDYMFTGQHLTFLQTGEDTGGELLQAEGTPRPRRMGSEDTLTPVKTNA